MRRKNILRRLRGARSGQATTEVVLLVPLFMFFLFAFSKTFALLVLVQKMEVVKVKKIKKKKKKYILNLDSPIVFKVPDLDESDILKEVEEMTKLEYQATALGNVGKGGPGKAAVGPEGAERGKNGEGRKQ